jgi:hypothetical protein
MKCDLFCCKCSQSNSQLTLRSQDLLAWTQTSKSYPRVIHNSGEARHHSTRCMQRDTVIAFVRRLRVPAALNRHNTAFPCGSKTATQDRRGQNKLQYKMIWSNVITRGTRKCWYFVNMSYSFLYNNEHTKYFKTNSYILLITVFLTRYHHLNVNGFNLCD